MKIIEHANPSHAVANFKLLLGFILAAMLARLATPVFIGFIPNFSPVDATALFCGVYFTRKSSAFLAILLSVWLSDILISKMLMGHWCLFYPGFYWQYACYVLIATMGSIFKHKINMTQLALASVTSSILFFVISNFGVWYGGWLYPMTLHGLVMCYTAAIPFFKNTLLSDLFFSLSFFMSFSLIQKYATTVNTLQKEQY